MQRNVPTSPGLSRHFRNAACHTASRDAIRLFPLRLPATTTTSRAGAAGALDRPVCFSKSASSSAVIGRAKAASRKTSHAPHESRGSK